MSPDESPRGSWWWSARGCQLLLLSLACLGSVFGWRSLAALQESMRLTLGWSDNQIAILQGTGPSLAMALASIPIGAWVDRHSRKRVILVFTLLNIFAGVVTALTSNYALMLVARIIAGIMSPGIIIAVLSLIADDFVPAERGRATMAMSIGQIAGTFLVTALGGWLLTVVGGDDAWRTSLLWLVVPLVPLLLVLIALKEPTRERTGGRHLNRGGFRLLWVHRRVFGVILAGAGIVGIADGASYIWIVPLLTRTFEMPSDRIGALFGTVILISGLAGPAIGGALADYCQNHGGPRVTASRLSALVLLSTPTGLFALAPTPLWMSVGMILFFTAGNAVSVAVGALITILMPERIRGLSVSMMIAFMVVCGAGMAPLLTSLLSGYLGGESMIGSAMVVISLIGGMLGAAAFWFGRCHFPVRVEKSTKDANPYAASVPSHR